MNESKLLSACDKALLLDYKAELLIPHKEYDNAIKKRKKAIVLIEKYHELEISERSLNLLLKYGKPLLPVDSMRPTISFNSS